MKTLVTYQSKTGFTKKYAEWISQELSCDLKALSEIKSTEIKAYDLVIHGGWIMGGMVSGLNEIRNLKPKKLIVFGVGFTAKSEVDTAKTIETNNLFDIPFFYYEGGMNPKKMGFVCRMIVKMVTKKVPVYQDNTSKESISELVKKAVEN